MSNQEKYLKRFFSHHKRHLFGCKLAQSGSALYVLEEILYIYHPDLIIELGSGNGILSKYFETYCILNGAEFTTCDIKKPDVPLCNFEMVDAYNEQTIKLYSERLNNAKKSFLFVDALDFKSTLVNMYTPFLKPNVIIAAHDIAFNLEKKPSWCFTEDQINWNYVERYEPYYSMSRELDTRTLYVRIK